MPLIETEEAARRLARAIASDLSLYNEDKIINGITNDNLFESLAEEIEEGRALYKRRVSPELYPKNFYDRALVDILIKAKGHIKSKIWECPRWGRRGSSSRPRRTGCASTRSSSRRCEKPGLPEPRCSAGSP